MIITLKLDIEDITFMQQILGELPSKTGAFKLMVKLDEQTQPQVNAQMMPPIERPQAPAAPEAETPAAPPAVAA